MNTNGLSPADLGQVKDIAAKLDGELRSLKKWNVPNERIVRQRYSLELKTASPDFVFALARELLVAYDLRSTAYEIIRFHKGAFALVGAAELTEFGQGIDSWKTVDLFARTLSGPAWLRGQVGDDLILDWAHSPDLWWRRSALVSTVALNMRSHGGPGDTPRTLMICRLLVDDHADMVVKALSWALRELVPHDPLAVRAFLSEYGSRLAGRVRREVNAKLDTGLKNPRRGKAEP
jgi:3-methyladenine DNA glycosylase AlkD